MRSYLAVIAKPYFVCEKPGMEPLFTRDDKPLAPKFHDWDEVIWGIPGKKLGRLPMALRIAQCYNAEKLLFTVGSAKFGDGSSEAEFMRRYVESSYGMLRVDFPETFPDYMFGTEQKYRQWLRQIVEFENEGHNTSSSLEIVAPRIREAAGNRELHVIVVTSANHVSRALRDTIVAFDKIDASAIIGAVAAQTSYGKKGPADVIIHELGDSKHQPWAKQ
jgi:hypothetical protein